MTTPKRCCLILAMLSIAAAGWAEQHKNESTLRLTVELSDGSRLIGTPAVTSVPIVCAVGKIDLPLDQVKTLTFRDDHEGVAAMLANGDHLTGVHNLGKLELSVLFGTVAIDPVLIRRIVCTRTRGGAGLRKGLVLWNSLDSEDDVRESRAGPGGSFKAGRFVPGRFGNGVELNMREQFGVTFPPEIVPGPDGCIEFWAKLTDFPSDLPWGDRPGLIAACDDKGGAHFMLHFNGNDGAANGGLCARVAGLGCAGTGQFGTWTYARAIGSDTAGFWHHYALVWAADGVKGVDDGTRKAAVFVDGQLNSHVWNGGTGDKLTVPTNGRFGFLCHQGVPSGRIIFDNLKIWNFAKTDFSDRDEE